jgi:hypothetical protein
MQQEAPEKFDGVQPHDALAIAVLVILPAEGDLAIVTGEESPIGDGHPMRIPSQIPEQRHGDQYDAMPEKTSYRSAPAQRNPTMS